MDKKKGIMIGSIVAVVLLAVVAAFAIIKLLNKGPAEYTVSFDSKGGEEVEKVKVKKDDDLILPTTTKEGYNFLGWYNEKDEKAESKVKVTKDMSFYAKWEEVPKENTFTVTFDSKGGSAVNPLVLKCDTELTLPTAPSRDGYTFDGWEDRNGRAILDQALFTCEDVTLYAKWIKKETPKKEEKPVEKPAEKPVETKKEYTCPSGYTLSGTKCTIEGTVHETCPSDTKADGALCIRTSDRNAGTRQCKEATVSIDGKGHTWTGKGDYYYIPNAYGNCAYYKWTDYTTQSQCEAANDIYHKTKWISYLNGCYADTKMNNYETVCASDYQFYTSAELSSKFGIHDNGQCLKKVAKTKYCDEGFTLTSGKCIKTIDATLK